MPRKYVLLYFILLISRVYRTPSPHHYNSTINVATATHQPVCPSLKRCGPGLLWPPLTRRSDAAPQLLMRLTAPTYTVKESVCLTETHTIVNQGYKTSSEFMTDRQRHTLTFPNLLAHPGTHRQQEVTATATAPTRTPSRIST